MARTVMIVDDIKYVRDLLKKILMEAHYQVVAEAENGQDAYLKYFQFRPNLVTMYLVMPEMSGIEAIRKIIKKDKEAKIVIVSAMEQENFVMDAINAGARDYILKPFRANDILKTFDHIMLDKTVEKATS